VFFIEHHVYHNLHDNLDDDLHHNVHHDHHHADCYFHNVVYYNDDANYHYFPDDDHIA
jgi:hypothetical protein